MSERHPYQTLDSLARRLPFPVDDYGRVNELFVEYATAPAGPTRNLEVQIELWTYCFVRQYLTMRLAHDDEVGGADLDMLLDTAFQRIRSGRTRVRQRYASWVSVVCKNCYLNYLRDRHPSDPLPRFDDPESVVLPMPYGSVSETWETMDAAIRRLPDYLRQVTHLRVLEELDYDEIAVIVDRPVTIVRSYIHKGIARLRADRTVCQALGKPTKTFDRIQIVRTT